MVFLLVRMASGMFKLAKPIREWREYIERNKEAIH
jgi:hypothetical protein